MNGCVFLPKLGPFAVSSDRTRAPILSSVLPDESGGSFPDESGDLPNNILAPGKSWPLTISGPLSR